MLAAMLLGTAEGAFPAFFCFFPVVLEEVARTIGRLEARVEELEGALGRAGADP